MNAEDFFFSGEGANLDGFLAGALFSMSSLEQLPWILMFEFNWLIDSGVLAKSAGLIAIERQESLATAFVGSRVFLRREFEAVLRDRSLF